MVDVSVPAVDSGKQPIGQDGRGTDRDTSGRFVRGNRAALVVGQRSAAFWEAHEVASGAIRRQVIEDAGYDERDAPRALSLVAEAIAQAKLLADSAFLRLVESGGPMTSAGRSRRAFVVWIAATDRLEKNLRLVGLRRAPKPAMSFAEAVAQAAAEQQQERDAAENVTL